MTRGKPTAAFLLGVPLILYATAHPAWAQPSARFELRLAPGQQNALLILDDPDRNTLELEVWVEVVDVNGGLLVWAYRLFLAVSTDGIIDYNQDYSSEAFTSGCVAAGTDNSPYSGDFDISCFQVGGSGEGIDSPALWGTFTITALELGATSYGFADVGEPRRWEVTLSDMTSIIDNDLSFSIDPALDDIIVTLPADTDDDGDVDLWDYAAFQGCATSAPGPLNGVCQAKDLNGDGALNGADVELFVKQITGAYPLQGDLNADGDVDLDDYARLQICMLKSNEPPLANLCRFADANHDQIVDIDDFTKLSEKLTGPQ